MPNGGLPRGRRAAHPEPPAKGVVARVGETMPIATGLKACHPHAPCAARKTPISPGL